MSAQTSLFNRLLRLFKPNQATVTVGKMSLDDYIAMRLASETPVEKQERVERQNSRRLNYLFHVQMHMDGATSGAIIGEARQLLHAGAKWDERQILFHIGGGSIHAGSAPTPICEAMLRFVQDRGVNLAPLREHADTCRNQGWLDLINSLEEEPTLEQSWKFLTRALLHSGCGGDPMEFLKTVKRPTVQGLREAMALDLAACELMVETGRKRSQLHKGDPMVVEAIRVTVHALEHLDEEALLPAFYIEGHNAFWTQEAMPIWTGKLAEEVIREVMRKKLDEATPQVAAPSVSRRI